MRACIFPQEISVEKGGSGPLGPTPLDPPLRLINISWNVKVLPLIASIGEAR